MGTGDPKGALAAAIRVAWGETAVVSLDSTARENDVGRCRLAQGRPLVDPAVIRACSFSTIMAHNPFSINSCLKTIFVR